MEADDLTHFDRVLLADEPDRVSRGTPALMNLMGVPRAPAPRGGD